MNPTTREGIHTFAKYGTRPEGFLFAVLSNDLKESFGRADLENRRDMFEIVSYCYNNVPSTAWGSPEKVTAWMDKKQKEREENAQNMVDTEQQAAMAEAEAEDQAEYETASRDAEEMEHYHDEPPPEE